MTVPGRTPTTTEEEVRSGALPPAPPAPPATTTGSGSPPANNSDDAEFWSWLVAEGYIEGDPTYYSSGDAAKEAGAYDNAIKVAFRSFAPGSAERSALVDRLYSEGIITSAKSAEGTAYWVNGTEESLGADMDNLGVAAESFFGGSGAPGDATGLGVMSGGTLTRITREGQDDLWAITYTYSGVRHIYTFAGFEDMEASLGKGVWGKGTEGNLVLDWETDIASNDGTAWVLGDADIVIGQTGSYQAYFGDVMREAGLRAGSRNPGWAGRYASDPEVQRIIAMATAGDWSEERIQAEIRLTGIYQEMYPGIDAFIRAGSQNPEAEWHNYMRSVTEGLAALGYELDDDGTYRSIMDDMLGAGISADKFNEFVPTFVRAEQSPEFASALNKWTEQDLGLSLNFEDWFDVLDGNSSPEIDAVVEKAELQFVADSSGTTLDDETISRLANLTDVSEQQMRIAFNSSEEALLAIGSADLERFGLSQEALVSAFFGIDSVGTDPLSTDGSSFSSAEIKKRARKAATELGIQDDRKAQFFVGFDSGGRPVRQGLSASAPEFG